MSWEVIHGDCLEVLAGFEAGSVHCCVTSPPYWGLRDYGVDGQIGLEASVGEYVDKLVAAFDQVWRVLRDDGTAWLNMGDAYAGGGRGGVGHNSTLNGGQRSQQESRTIIAKRNHCPDRIKAKDLIGLPWMIAFALRDAGWYLRAEIIWAKPNPMPESATDRPGRAHEQVFLLSKRARYYYDAIAVQEACLSGPSDKTKMAESLYRIGGLTKASEDPLCSASSKTKIGRKRAVGDPEYRNKRSVWDISTEPYPGAHFATYPTKLVEPCIKAGTSLKGCCAKCGAPWVRQLEKLRLPTRPGTNSKTRWPTGWDARKGDHDTRDLNTEQGQQRSREAIGNRDPLRHVTVTRTVGWSASCNCDAGDPVPCVVLDPFVGSGTTGVVARRLGQRFVGIELNEQYCELARRRIHDDAPLFNTVVEACG